MKKNFKFYVIAWAILFAIFNISVFIFSNEAAGMSRFAGVFWAGYVFITLAFIGQLLCAYFAFKGNDSRKLFLNLPLITISYSALIVSVIFGTVCMVIPDLPNWVGIVLCMIILGLYAVAVVKAKAAAEIVSGVDDRVKANTFFIKSLTVDIESITTRANSDMAKAAAKKVYDAVRYSDPMSSDALADLESQINLRVNEFINAVVCGTDNVNVIADELVILLNDRNKKCGLLK